MASPDAYDILAQMRQTVALMRRSGVPDPMIAAQLGLTMEEFRHRFPDDPSNPLGFPPRPGVEHVPGAQRGHSGDPFAGVTPYQAPTPAPQGGADLSPFQTPTPAPESGAGVGVLVLLLLFFA